MNRREFLIAGGMLGTLPHLTQPAPNTAADRLKIRPALATFDYRNVRLLPGMFRTQTEQTRETYFALPDDDVLHGFRERAGMPAPGHNLSGWCAKTSAVVFGQWLSGMARMACALHDDALREKAVRLAEGWAQTTRNNHYDLDAYCFDKTVCGLVDLALYADYSDAWVQLARMTEWASNALDRSRQPATPMDRDGRKPHGVNEWYTLSENLYRAYLANGDDLYKNFGDVWLYSSFWNQFLTSTHPPGAKYLHSYSHCNTFSSAAMAYVVTSDANYLQILRNAYEWMRLTQCFASGGYGPGEWSVAGDGDLGNSLDFRSDSAEIPCGTWGGFKLSKYLLEFTGEARYGDWIERLLYNGIGAALPVQLSGNSFYYADYRIGMAQKEYFWDRWPCCSGTYIQAVADYHDLIYFRDTEGLAVNLYLPSEVDWDQSGEHVSLRQETSFPETDSINFRLLSARPVRFRLRLRVPQWAHRFALSLNGQWLESNAQPGEWASIERVWNPKDQLTVSMPMKLRLEAIDSQHPHRCAVLYGPVLLAQDARYTSALAAPSGEDVSQLLAREGARLFFKARQPSGHEQITGPFAPLYQFREDQPYRVYFDMQQLRFL